MKLKERRKKKELFLKKKIETVEGLEKLYMKFTELSNNAKFVTDNLRMINLNLKKRKSSTFTDELLG